MVMASVDLDRLCFHLSSMQADKLHSLQDDDSLTIPLIRGMTIPTAVASIRSHIAAMSDMKDRLCCINEIYLSLMEKGVMAPWLFARNCDTRGTPEDTPMARYFQNVKSNMDFIYSMDVTEERTHICAMLGESSTPNVGLDVYCFCFWPPVQGVAVFKPQYGFSRRQQDVLREMLGNGREFCGFGPYQDLNSAHSAGVFVASCSSSE